MLLLILDSVLVSKLQLLHLFNLSMCLQHRYFSLIKVFIKSLWPKEYSANLSLGFQTKQVLKYSTIYEAVLEILGFPLQGC